MLVTIAEVDTVSKVVKGTVAVTGLGVTDVAVALLNGAVSEDG